MTELQALLSTWLDPRVVGAVVMDLERASARRARDLRRRPLAHARADELGDARRCAASVSTTR